MDVANLRVLFSAEGDRNVTGAIDRVNRKLDTVDNHARKAGSAIDGMFKVAGGFLLAQGITNAAGAVLTMNSNAEQAKVALEVALGSAEEAEATFDRVQKMAAATPFGTQELLNSTIQLESLGLSSEQWLNTIGDTAAGTNKSIDQVTQAALDASFGEYERLKEFGIQARVEGEKVAFTYMKNGEQITETVDKNNKEIIQSTIQGIWNDKYQGAMEKQSRTFAGQWSTLKDNAAITMMNMTEGIFGSLTEVLDFANEVFSDGLVDAVRNIAGPFEDVADIVATLFEAFATNGEGVSDLMNVLFGPGSPMANAPQVIQDVAGSLLLIADALGDLWTAAQNGNFLAALGEELANIAAAGIDLGEIAVRFAWGEITQIGASLWERFSAYAAGGEDPMLRGLGGIGISSGEPLTTIDIIIDGAIRLIGDWENLEARIAEELGLARTDAELSAAQEEGRMLGNDIWNAFTDGLSDSFGGGDGGASSEKMGKISQIAGRIVELTNPFMQIKAIWDSNTIFSEWMHLGVGVGQEIFDSFIAGISAAFNGTETMASRINPFSEGAVLEGGLAGWLNETSANLLKDIPAPTLPDWLTTNWSWITGPIATLTGYVEDLFGLISRAISGRTTADSAMNVQPLMPFGMGGDTPRMTPDRQVQEQIIDVNQFVNIVPTVVNPNWLSELDLGLGGVSPGERAAAQTDFSVMTTIDADTSPFDTAKAAVDAALQTWDATTSTATFDIDNGPAAVAYTEAFGWGNVWASQVFTARFSIDTSGLAAAEQAALATAQRIRDILPSSPAKKGPFAGPVPSLDYIADSFRASFSRMESEANAGIAGVRRAMAGRAERGGRRSVGPSINNPTYHIYPETGDGRKHVTAAVIGDWRS